jgi:nitrogen regulatory protein PII
LLRIDAVISNANLSQLKARLEQAGISNFSVYDMGGSDPGDSDSGIVSFRPSYCIPRSKIEVICKNSEKDTIIDAISNANYGVNENGIIYVNQLTPHIQIRNTNNLQDGKT